MRVARWEAFVLIGHALWADALTYWWFGPLVVFIAVAAGWKKLARLAGKVFSSYVSSHH